METEQIYRQLTPILREVFDDDHIEATPDLSAYDVNRWDSLAHVRLMLAAENLFKVKFSTSEIVNSFSVKDLVALIVSHTSMDKFEEK